MFLYGATDAAAPLAAAISVLAQVGVKVGGAEVEMMTMKSSIIRLCLHQLFFSARNRSFFTHKKKKNISPSRSLLLPRYRLPALTQSLGAPVGRGRGRGRENTSSSLRSRWPSCMRKRLFMSKSTRSAAVATRGLTRGRRATAEQTPMWRRRRAAPFSSADKTNKSQLQ